MMQSIYILITFLLPLGLGYSLVLYLTHHNPLPKPFSLAIGYGLGTGLLTQWMLLLGVTGIPLTSAVINTPFFLGTLILVYTLRKKGISMFSRNFPITNFFKSLDFPSIIMVSYIALYMAYIFWRSFNIPISSWDAFSVYALQAKVFFYERSLEHHSNLPHSTYPLHTPFLQAWIAINLGEWNGQLVKFFYPFYFLCYLIIQSHFLKSFASIRWTLLSLVFLVSSSFLVYHSTIAYRDMIMLYYYCSSIILLVMWYKSKDAGLLILASLLGGFMTFNKLEGIGYFFIQILVVSIILLKGVWFSWKDKVLNFFRFTMPGLAIFLFYQTYLTLAVIPRTTLHAAKNLNTNLQTIKFQLTLASLKKMWIIAGRILEDLFLSNNWNIVWAILFVSLLNVRSIRRGAETKLILLFLLLSNGMLLFGYSFTQHYYWASQTNTVVSRGILHTFPLATMLIVLINFSTHALKPSKRIEANA